MCVYLRSTSCSNSNKFRRKSQLKILKDLFLGKFICFSLMLIRLHFRCVIVPMKDIDQLPLGKRKKNFSFHHHQYHLTLKDFLLSVSVTNGTKHTRQYVSRRSIWCQFPLLEFFRAMRTVRILKALRFDSVKKRCSAKHQTQNNNNCSFSILFSTK